MEPDIVTATETPTAPPTLAEHIAAEARADAGDTAAAVADPIPAAAAEPEAEADSLAPDAELSDAGRALRKGRLDKRIDKLKELNEQLRINKELRAEPERVAPARQTQTAAVSAGTTDDPEPDPKSGTYPAEEYDPAYIRDMARWTARQEVRTQHQAHAERVTRQEADRALEAKATIAREKYSDYDAVIQPVIDTFVNDPREMVITEFVRDSTVGGEVVYALGKDAKAMDALRAARSSVEVVRELVRLEARLLEPAKAPKPQTSAPAPPKNTVGSGGSTAGSQRPATSTREHMEREDAEIAERRKAGHRY